MRMKRTFAPQCCAIEPNHSKNGFHCPITGIPLMLVPLPTLRGERTLYTSNKSSYLIAISLSGVIQAPGAPTVVPLACEKTPSNGTVVTRASIKVFTLLLLRVVRD